MNIVSFTPRIPKHYLFLVAALVWTFAGGMLLFRGYSFLIVYPHFLAVKMSGCLISGLIFFKLLFVKISGKHVVRIENLPIDHPCLFSFFNLKSYLMMTVMISSGILLRKTGAISPEYLSLVYVTMGIPLLMSSFRFYYTFFLNTDDSDRTVSHG
ncbi:MAG TPA: hypothetical protein VFC65_09365 [Prolixibacteraceae bacterium]|nr:hypothetical protein [Prolixibacteraceae bacterium]